MGSFEGELLRVDGVMVILSMLSAACPRRQGLGRRNREMSKMSSIQGRRDPQRHLRTIERHLRHSRTGTRLWASALSRPAMNRQSSPATCKEAPPDACVAFGRKSHHSRVAASALRFTAFAARILLAPASADIYNSRKCTTDTNSPRTAQNRCDFRARGGVHSPATQLAEELPQRCDAAARAPHTSPATTAAAKPHTKHGRRRTNTKTSPPVFNRLTPRNAQALFHQKQGTTSTIRR